MVRQAICNCGRNSEIFICKGTLTKDVYIKAGLQKRFLPFIRSHAVPPLFWPDLASVHYAKDTINWYEANKVVFVPKEVNPHNCSHLRPIETYWALLKQQLMKTGKEAKNVVSFAWYWKNAAQRVRSDVVKRLMARLSSKVFKFSREPLDG